MVVRRRFKKRTFRRRTRIGRRRVRTRRLRHVRRRVGRRSQSIPTRSSKELGFIYSFTSATGIRVPQNTWCRAPNAIGNQWRPYQAFAQLFKEFKVIGVLVAVRRRYPEAVEYQPNQQEQTVAASRLSTNNIWWAPWSTQDPPNYPPRMIKSAILLSGRWTVRRLKCKWPRVAWDMAGSGANDAGMVSTAADQFFGASSLNSLINPGNAQSTRYRSIMMARPYWGNMPWMSVGVDNAAQLGMIPTGFFLVENQSIIPDDDLEVRVKVRYAFRKRKNLAGALPDNSGAFSFAPLMGAEIIDVLGTAPKTDYLQENLNMQQSSGLPIEVPDITEA